MIMSPPSSLLLVLAATHLVSSASVRVPLNTLNLKRSLSQTPPQQKHLTNPSLHSSESAQIPLTRNLTHELLFFTSIAIGDPPQHFQVLLDISSADSFVSSANCSRCFPGDTKYDSSQSISFTTNRTALNLDYNYVATTGTMAQDTFLIGDLEVPGQLFQEALTVDLIGLSWDDMSVTHGALGLAPYNEASVLRASSPFENMATHHLLDQNLFSLRLREPRELMFGGTNEDLYTGNFTDLSLTHETGGYFLNGSWQVSAQSISLGTQPAFKWNLQGYSAAFTTAWAPIGVPQKVAYELLEALQFEDIMFMPMSVPCERRAVMPDVSIELDGHRFVLSPYDYTYEWPVKGARTRCVAAFEGYEARDAKEIVLGSAFLRGFYSVFDYDKQRMSLAKLKL